MKKVKAVNQYIGFDGLATYTRLNLLGVVALSLFATTGIAADIDWNNAAGGVFGTASNWTGGIAPSPSDAARFNLGGAAYNVSLAGNQSIDQLRIGNDTVTLDLGAFTYNLTHTSTVGSSLEVGQGSGDIANLTVRNGALSTQVSEVGAGGSTATLNISTGATWQASNFNTINANGTVNVVNGGVANISSSTDVMGALNISGAGSHWSSLLNNTIVDIGGALHISNAARFDSNIGISTNSTALIEGVGTVANGTVSLGGGTGVSTLTVQNGAALTGSGLIGSLRGHITRGDGVVNIDGVGTSWNAVTIDVGLQTQGFLNISGGAQVASQGQTTVAFENGGFVTVDGAGSRLDSNGLAVGAGDNASLTVSNAAVVSTTQLNVGSAAARNKRQVTVDVGGAGSSLNASLNMDVTSSSLSGAANNTTVTIHDGASMTVGNALKVTQGVITFANGGSGTIGTGAVETAANTLRIYSDGDLQLNTKPINTAADTVLNAGVIELAGDLSGAGTINANVNNTGGHVGPGNSFVNETRLGVFTGTLLVNGDYTQDAAAELVIGLEDAALHDLLDISGTATLDGLLSVSLDNSFMPVLGDSFDILAADTIVGQFSTLDTSLAPLGAGLTWDLSYVLDPTLSDTVRLSVVSAVPVPAAMWLFGSGLLGLVGVAGWRVDRS